MIKTTGSLSELESILTGHWLTDLANFSSFFYQHLPNLNWVGFYLSDGKLLRLGPFQGKPACTEIAFDRGVCGAALSRREIMLVDDVEAFPGHIACDSASKSELVLPFYVGGKLIGVLDLDAPVLARFTKDDAGLLTRALEILAKKNPNLAEVASHLRLR